MHELGMSKNDNIDYTCYKTLNYFFIKNRICNGEFK